MTSYKFGKHEAVEDVRTLKFSNYLTKALPSPPVAFNNLTEVFDNLKEYSPSVLFPIDGNDLHGNCTICAVAHATTLYSGLINKKIISTVKEVLSVYNKLTGGQDTGLNVLKVLNYWKKNQFSGNNILCYTKINPKNHDHVKLAVRHFGGVYVGFNVQKDCMTDFNIKKTWTPGPLLNEGHAVYCSGYDISTVDLLTWGTVQKGTWGWWDACVDEAYAILPLQATDPSFCPGFKFSELLVDLKQVSN